MCVMDEAVENGAGIGGISDNVVPAIDRELARYDTGAAGMAPAALCQPIASVMASKVP